MTEPVYFVVERGPGGSDSPSVIYDRLPERLTRKGSTLLVYSTRLDMLPNAAALIQQSPQSLYRLYCQLRDKGKLPPQTGGKMR